jgi:hypothetical protein
MPALRQCCKDERVDVMRNTSTRSGAKPEEKYGLSTSVSDEAFDVHGTRKTVNINAQFGIAASELRLRDIAAANANDPLRLPTNMRYLAAGGEAALAQLILTWAQKSETRKLQTFITSTDDPNVVEISRRLFGMTAVLSARSVSGKRLPPITPCL